MKTHTIKSENAELLVVELPETGSTFDILTAINSETEGYTLLGKPDEIREEDAKELVKEFQFGTKEYPHLCFLDYKTDYFHCFSAKESLLSLLESEIYWENPIDIKGQTFSNEHTNRWEEAELRTFDRNRSIIFVKNQIMETTLNTLKNRYAQEQGYEDWIELVRLNILIVNAENEYELDKHYTNICIRAQKAALEKAAENIRIDYSDLSIDETTITNPENLIK